ncbi:MAG: response regulator [Geothrix sp.]|uniref:response regulator n=1 Tax=Geothrix sp. TaxID=1962974 RepID=UPI0017FC7C2E|nr:response regulator [Geothrix sp.]NWJ39930.1 response regulator [Geothrix sp.]WIL22058.1 MAG: response regulator [Geothrix sp.]
MKRPVVLIVEDCPNDLALLMLAIEKAGVPFETAVATDGQEALDWLFRKGAHEDRDEEVYPALVLMDLKLPRLSGLDVLRALRQEPRGWLTPVVAMTTSEMPSDIQKAYAFGANAYVQKPMDFNGLVRLVEALRAFWLSFNVIHPMMR